MSLPYQRHHLSFRSQNRSFRSKNRSFGPRPQKQQCRCSKHKFSKVHFGEGKFSKVLMPCIVKSKKTLTIQNFVLLVVFWPETAASATHSLAAVWGQKNKSPTSTLSIDFSFFHSEYTWYRLLRILCQVFLLAVKKKSPTSTLSIFYFFTVNILGY
jgi:hypothetical protein